MPALRMHRAKAPYTLTSASNPGSPFSPYPLVNSSHELKLMGFRLSGFQAALRQVPGDSSLLSLQPRLSGQFLPF